MGTFNRRSIITAGASALLYPAVSRAQGARLNGRIAFVKEGDIYQWSADGVAEVKVDGAAKSPTWNPGTNEMMYVRDGGSFSNLIVLDIESHRTRRITSSESDLQPGSEAWVWDSVWITDPCWSESGIVTFASTDDSLDGVLQLWILRYDTSSVFLAPHDGGDSGRIERTSVDSNGLMACYTVTGLDGMSAYIGVRNLDTGETQIALQGARQAYDGAISPDGSWVIGTIRDSEGRNDLWLTNVGEGGATRLTEGEEASAAVWDPWGEWVAYLAFTGKGFSLRAFKVDFTSDPPEIDGDILTLIEEDNIDSTSRLSWGR